MPSENPNNQYNYTTGQGLSALDPATPRDVDNQPGGAFMLEIPAAIRQIKAYLIDSSFAEQDVDNLLAIVYAKLAQVNVPLLVQAWTQKTWTVGSTVKYNDLVYVALVTTNKVPGDETDWLAITYSDFSTASWFQVGLGINGIGAEPGAGTSFRVSYDQRNRYVGIRGLALVATTFQSLSTNFPAATGTMRVQLDVGTKIFPIFNVPSGDLSSLNYSIVLADGIQLISTAYWFQSSYSGRSYVT